MSHKCVAYDSYMKFYDSKELVKCDGEEWKEMKPKMETRKRPKWVVIESKNQASFGQSAFFTKRKEAVKFMASNGYNGILFKLSNGVKIEPIVKEVEVSDG